MSSVRLCREDERTAILAIVNTAAMAYRGVIPADRWHEPYMTARELDAEMDSGVVRPRSCWPTRLSMSADELTDRE
ncbi:MAG TPA: hypothetical protein VES90_02975 [Candidatus Eisenbacteria bacterium]|nr:hypothetical protein [Candidatus Eisenbacteria bacterium]